MEYQSVRDFSLEEPGEMQAIVKNGLKAGKKPKNIIVIGAGMAGLVAGSLLKEAGHHVTILEGNNRVGGRVFTVRAPFYEEGYLDVGAMRIPASHKLVSEYIKKFNLPVNKFINATPNDLIHVNGITTTRAAYEQNPEVLGYPLPPHETGKTATELFLYAVQPFLDLFHRSTPEQRKALKIKYDRFSMDNFLRHNPFDRSLSPNATRIVKILLGIEGFPEFSFINILTDIVNTVFDKETNFYEITGGNDQLPASFLPQLQDNILYDQKVNRIIQREQGVIVNTKDFAGNIHAYTGDVAIVTVPFSVLQFIEIFPYDSFSFGKWKAIRDLPMVASVKIGIQFRNRFWEKEGLSDANLITDLPIRFTYTPSHKLRRGGPGVLLASYSWADNSLLWNSLSEEEQTIQTLQGLAKVYGDQVYQEYLTSVSFSWSHNPFSAGCFTLFKPGQITELSGVIKRPEGRVHFAGEHTSSKHGWIEGAVESGARVAQEVNEEP